MVSESTLEDFDFAEVDFDNKLLSLLVIAGILELEDSLVYSLVKNKEDSLILTSLRLRLQGGCAVLAVQLQRG